MKRNRIFALMLAVIMLLYITSAGAFIALEAGHECFGEDCPICAAIAVCAGTLQLLGLSAVVSLSLLAAQRCSLRCATFPPVWFSQKTPVSLKVLLLN